MIRLDVGLFRAQRDEAASVTEPASGASLGWLRRNSVLILPILITAGFTLAVNQSTQWQVWVRLPQNNVAGNVTFSTDIQVLSNSTYSHMRMRQTLAHLCRYIARPAVSNERIELTECGHVSYRLKTPYRDGTTHVYFSPLDFMARLAALVPKPRVNLTRFHGVFAPNSKVRGEVVKSKRGRRMTLATTPAEKRQAMSWAKRLKRVFQMDITQCGCGGTLKLLASIEDEATIRRILAHLDKQARGPPLPSPR